MNITGIRDPKPAHLFLALHFMKCNETEELNTSWAGFSEPTFAKWTWFYAEGIANLDKQIVSAGTIHDIIFSFFSLILFF